MSSNLVKIVLAGEGGQGVQSVANILVEAAYQRGHQALYIPNFGVEQRGGVSVAFVQISDENISSLKFAKADVVVALSQRAMVRTDQYVDDNTTYIYEGMLDGSLAPACAQKVLSIPAMEIASRDFHPRVFNVLVMGAVVGVIPMLDMEDVAQALVHKLQYKFDKEPALKKMNLDALQAGARYFADQQ